VQITTRCLDLMSERDPELPIYIETAESMRLSRLVGRRNRRNTLAQLSAFVFDWILNPLSGVQGRRRLKWRVRIASGLTTIAPCDGRLQVAVGRELRDVLRIDNQDFVAS
jgi:hypothetical protein